MQRTSAITPRQTIRGHTDWAQGVVYLPGGRRIITCSLDGSLRLWNLESGKQIGDNWLDKGDNAEVVDISLSPNGNTVASGGYDGTVRLWDTKKGEVVTRWMGHTDRVRSVCWSLNGKRVLSGSWDGTVRVWDVESDQTILKIVTGGANEAATYSPDATKIATGGYINYIMVNQSSLVTSAKMERDKTTCEPQGTNEAAGRSPETRKFAIGSEVKIWDANTGKLLYTIKHDKPVWGLQWTSDEKKLFSTSEDGSIRIFDTTTWQQIAILNGHEDTVESASLTRNDLLLASASWDSPSLASRQKPPCRSTPRTRRRR
jgi:WD40 repeat protein